MKKNSVVGMCILLALLVFSAGMHSTASAKPKSRTNSSVKVTKRSAPLYPARAYNKGIGFGYAKIAFYVDEIGAPSDFLAIEYSHKIFADQLMKVLPKWEYEPAMRGGHSIKSICRAHWEFYPDRPIITDSFSNLSRHIDKKGSDSYRELEWIEEKELDRPLTMLSFPPIIAPEGFDPSVLEDGKAKVKCGFYVDLEGRVVLPQVFVSTAKELDPFVLQSLSGANFDFPHRGDKRVIAYLEKTYKMHVVLQE